MEQPQLTYFKEIKYRTYQVILGFFFGFLMAQKERLNLIFALIVPLISSLESPSIDFVYLTITEAFTVQIQISLIVGLFFSLPLLWLQVGFFISPALYRKEQKSFFLVALLSWILLSFSIYFTQEYLLPQAWSFFLSYGHSMNPDSGSKLIINSEESLLREPGIGYLPSFGPQVFLFIEVFFAMILTSQIPLLFFLLIHWGYLRRQFFIKGRPWAIIILLLWSALLSPPDLISQIFIFIPFFLIQEITIFFLIFQKIYYSTSRSKFKTGFLH